MNPVHFVTSTYQLGHLTAAQVRDLDNHPAATGPERDMLTEARLIREETLRYRRFIEKYGDRVSGGYRLEPALCIERGWPRRYKGGVEASRNGRPGHMLLTNDVNYRQRYEIGMASQLEGPVLPAPLPEPVSEGWGLLRWLSSSRQDVKAAVPPPTIEVKPEDVVFRYNDQGGNYGACVEHEDGSVSYVRQQVPPPT